MREVAELQWKLSMPFKLKYALKASGITSLEYFRRNDVKRDPVNSKLIGNIQRSREYYHHDLEENKEEKRKQFEVFQKQQMRLTSKRKAIEFSRQQAKRMRFSHYKKMALKLNVSKQGE